MRFAGNVGWVTRPSSNVGGEGPVEVGSRRSMNEFGAYDVVGNVREWNSGFMNDGSRFTRGGAWTDPEFTVGWRAPVDAFDRSPTNGVRLLMHHEDDPVVLEAMGRTWGNNRTRSYEGLTPVGNSEFEIFKRVYDYDAMPLDTALEAEGQTAHYDWKKVSFAAAYGGERSAAYVFLPKDAQPPHQPILYWPGSNAMNARAMDHEWISEWTGFIIRSGRALVLPLFNGSYERDDPEFSQGYPGASNRELKVQWMIDLRRTVEYLMESGDYDVEHLGFYGHSWGGATGPVAMVLEPRIKAAVLDVGGLRVGFVPAPEYDAFHFAPRVTAPVLMLNGEYDQAFPLETAQKPLYELLGSEHKEHYVFTAGHVVPRGEVITKSLAWWDRFLGIPGG